MIENALAFLHQVIEKLSESDFLAGSFLLKNKGLELIFKILNFSSK